MESFSVKCSTKRDSYSFARLAIRLNTQWRSGEALTPNNTKWGENAERTHYNVHVNSSGMSYITYGWLDEDIYYDMIPSEKLDSINTWEDVKRLINEI